MLDSRRQTNDDAAERNSDVLKICNCVSHDQSTALFDVLLLLVMLVGKLKEGKIKHKYKTGKLIQKT
jgi:hypothetical protein